MLKIRYPASMNPLMNRRISAILLTLLIYGMGCATQETIKVYEVPPPSIPTADNKLFAKALAAQNAGQVEEAVKQWKRFLSRHPNSFEARNNLGQVYYTENQVTQALQEFERAYRLEPVSEKIRKNLNRALKFQADLLYESKEYDRVIRNLKRMKQVSLPKERQGLDIKIEQVEDTIFEQVQRADTTRAYEEFISKYPEGLNAKAARKRLLQLTSKSSKATTLEDIVPISPGSGVLGLAEEEQAVILEENSLPETPVGEIIEETVLEEESVLPSTPPDKMSASQAETLGEDEAVEFEPWETLEGDAPVLEEPELLTKPKAIQDEITPEPPAATEAVKPVETGTLEDIVPISPGSGVLGLAEEEQAVILEENSLPETPVGEIIEETVLEEESVLPSTPPDKMSASQAETLGEDEAVEFEPWETLEGDAPVLEEPELLTKPKAIQDEITPEPPAATEAVKPVETAQLTLRESKIRIQVASHLNVRAAPSARGKIVGQLSNGDERPLLSEKPQWFQIEFTNGRTGWVFRKFARKLRIQSLPSTEPSGFNIDGRDPRIQSIASAGFSNRCSVPA